MGIMKRKNKSVYDARSVIKQAQKYPISSLNDSKMTGGGSITAKTSIGGLYNSATDF